MEPMGLLPLLAGYGSIAGLVWLGCLLGRNLPREGLSQRLLLMTAGIVLLFMAPPDLIPAVVAFSIFLVPRSRPETAFGEAIACAPGGSLERV